MFGLNPSSLPVAIAEILVLLLVASLVGWLLAYLLLSGQVRALQVAIAEVRAELTNHHRQKEAKNTVPAQPVQPATDSVNLPTVEPVTPTPAMPAVPVMAAPVLEMPIEVIPVVTPGDVPTANVAALSASFREGSSEDAVLSRIAARASEVNFDRIGRASAAEADDLKDIVGIGPFLERKLHCLGLYTFRQIANFTKEDISKVNELIEFFPGRIERDDWVGQSKSFHERKYGAKKES